MEGAARKATKNQLNGHEAHTTSINRPQKKYKRFCGQDTAAEEEGRDLVPKTCHAFVHVVGQAHSKALDGSEQVPVSRPSCGW